MLPVSVFWLVCQQDYTKTDFHQTWIEQRMDLGPEQNPLTFGVDPHKENGSRNVFLTVFNIEEIGGPIDVVFSAWSKLQRTSAFTAYQVQFASKTADNLNPKCSAQCKEAVVRL